MSTCPRPGRRRRRRATSWPSIPRHEEVHQRHVGPELGGQRQHAVRRACLDTLIARRDIGDKFGLGDTLIDLGNFYDDGGDHDQALKMYKESLQIQRDLSNETLQAVCLNNIGAVYFEKAQYEDARTYYQQALQLREKANVPKDIVESVHNLAETSVRMGQYDQAVSQYMRALDLWRSMEDARGVAVESYTLGVMFDYQGRFGAALNSKQQALKTFQDLKDKTFWMAEILGGYVRTRLRITTGAAAAASCPAGSSDTPPDLRRWPCAVQASRPSARRRRAAGWTSAAPRRRWSASSGRASPWRTCPSRAVSCGRRPRAGA